MPYQSAHAQRTRLTIEMGSWRAGCGASRTPGSGGGPGKRNGRKPRHRAPGRPHLGTQVVDEVRRRVQQDTLDRRGHRDDPLYKIRGLLRRGREHLSDTQIVKLNTCLIAGDPGFEVTVAWHAYQQLRSMYQADTAAEGKRIAEQVIGSFGDCPIPEVARLGRTLKMWREYVLARFESHRISNGDSEEPLTGVTTSPRLWPRTRPAPGSRMRSQRCTE